MIKEEGEVNNENNSSKKNVIVYFVKYQILKLALKKM